MTHHIIICTGRPASGKTTLLKELEKSSNKYSYTDADASSGPIRMRLSRYNSKAQLLDSLFMDTNRLLPLLDAMREMGHNKLTIYRFEDDHYQCLKNDKLRPVERRAGATIDKPYYIDFGLLITEYPDIEIEIIDTPVYKPAEWELFFHDAAVPLSYKTIEHDCDKTYEIVQGRVNKRYITSDYWDTNRRSKSYDGDWEESWSSDSDNEPVKFEELENLLSTIPTLTYKQGLEIAELVKVVSYSVNDYYYESERHYHCIDAELLYNYLIATELSQD